MSSVIEKLMVSHSTMPNYVFTLKVFETPKHRQWHTGLSLITENSLKPGLFPKCNYGFYTLGYETHLYYLENFYIHNATPTLLQSSLQSSCYHDQLPNAYVPVKAHKVMQVLLRG